MLNTRFNFDNDKLNLYVKALKPTHKQNPTNYYQMNLRGDFDVIEREILQIQKKELDEKATVMDYTALETLRAQMRRNDRDYEISVARDVLFATEKENEHYRREKWDLSTQRMQMWMNLGLGLGQSSASVMGGQYLMHYKQHGKLSALGGGADVADKVASIRHLGAAVSAISAFKAVGSAAKSISNAVVSNMIFDERANRIETDRKFAFRDLAFRSLQIDLRHRDVQEDGIRTLNRMANVYSRGVINDLDAIDEFNKENKLGSINLTVFTPSKEQLKLLEALKEEYGIDCDIPNAVIRIYEGMGDDIIRFKHLESKGVIGISNTVEREYLMSILEMGIKVVDKCGDSKRRERRSKELYACANIYELTQQIENHRILTEDAGRINADLRDEIGKLKADVDAKIHELDDKNSTIEQLNATIEEKDREIVDHNLAVVKAREECDKALASKDAQLEDEKRSRKEETEELTQQLNDERRRYLNERDRANMFQQNAIRLQNDWRKANEETAKCTQELESVKAQLAERDLSAWNEEKKRLEDQIKEWKDKYLNRPREEYKETPGQCQMFRDMLSDPYEFDLKARGNG